MPGIASERSLVFTWFAVWKPALPSANGALHTTLGQRPNGA